MITKYKFSLPYVIPIYIVIFVKSLNNFYQKHDKRLHRGGQ